MDAKKILGRLLTAFVLISIGFAIGRETAGGRPGAPATPPASGGDRVIVYYMHGTFRCVTCNTVESLAEGLLRTEFSEEAKAGRLEWRSVDYLEDTALAGRYQVAGNMLVLSRLEGGAEVRFRKLDRVMELAGDPEGFRGYVRPALRDLLAGLR
jgi:hypothetical protein